MSKDYYKILGLDKNASAEEIKTAFRKEAHKHHPDKGGNEEKFKEINEAYQVLGNKEKKQQYDQFGSSFSDTGGFRSQGYSGFSGINIDDFGDIFGGFGDIFGGFGSRPRGPEPGQEIELVISIDFLESIHGAEKEISYIRFKSCGKCSGSGDAPGAKIETCPTCNGRGSILKVQNTILGAIQSQSTCPDCDGKGKKASASCSACQGLGRLKGTEKLRIKIPAGINDGGRIRLSGYGHIGEKGMPSGDLYLQIRVKKHAKFSRQGDDIFSEIYISVSQAILGDRIELETAHGPVKLKIPEGTQAQSVFRIKNKGANRLRGNGKGDHFVKLKVKIPKNLTKKQKEILASLSL